MLYTNLKHIESTKELSQVIAENEFLVIICGRMGVMSIPVYRILIDLEKSYPHVRFFDIEYDNPESELICRLLEERGYHNIPLIVYYKAANLVHITEGMQSKDDIKTIIESNFNIEINA